MSVTNPHGIWAVKIDTTVLGGITAADTGLNTDLIQDGTSGEVHPRFQAVAGQRPTAGFTTKAIAAALDEAALTGVSIASLSAKLTMYGQAFASGGTRASGANHLSYTINHGLLYPGVLSCQHRGDAELTYNAAITYDGTNDPIVIAASQSLPAGIADAERFTLPEDGVVIETEALGHLRSLELNFGINVQTEGDNSDIWDTFPYIAEIIPVLTLRGIDPEWLGDTVIPLIGKAATHANTTIYLRKRAAGGTFVSDVTAEHIKFTMAGLAHIAQPFSGMHNGAMETSLSMPLYYDGTNDPVTIDTTSAIT